MSIAATSQPHKIAMTLSLSDTYKQVSLVSATIAPRGGGSNTQTGLSIPIDDYPGRLLPGSPDWSYAQ